MSNPTMAKRIDGEPIDVPALGKIVSFECESSDVSDSLISNGYASARIDGSSISCHFLSQNRCFVIEPRGEPGLTTMFNVCRAYSRDSGIRMVVFDQEFTFMLCVDGDSRIENFFQKMNDDPYEAERILNEMGLGG